MYQGIETILFYGCLFYVLTWGVNMSNRRTWLAYNMSDSRDSMFHFKTTVTAAVNEHLTRAMGVETTM